MVIGATSRFDMVSVSLTAYTFKRDLNVSVTSGAPLWVLAHKSSSKSSQVARLFLFKCPIDRASISFPILTSRLNRHSIPLDLLVLVGSVTVTWNCDSDMV